MDATCKDYRDEWLAGARGTREHASRCAECASWTAARERELRALGLVSFIPAPTELDARVAAELARDPAVRVQRIEHFLGSLVRLAAPAELEARVNALLAAPRSAEDRGRDGAAALGAMDVLEAPPVLERLVEEELANPARARIERFPGSLTRLPAPAELERRLSRSGRRTVLARLVLAPLVALSAAGLVVWLAVRTDEPEPRRHRFEVVHATSLDDLDPMARSLAGSLAGADPR